MSLDKQVTPPLKKSQIQEAVGELAADQREKLESKAELAEAAAQQTAEESLKDVADEGMD
ncbi:hypothetical protein [Synechococcus sp. OH20]|uniref:hypothetical protein n=1 Tax=Synechococcus sp. OH20 TaxID=139337 RepID=UPI0039C67CE2